MRRVLTFLVVTAVIIAAAWWLAALPGTVNAQIGATSVAAPTPVALLGLLILFVLLYVVFRILTAILRLPGRSRRMRQARERKRGEEAVTRTLLALAGGDGEEAMREAKRSRALLGDTPQTLLLAAYAGRQGGNQDAENAAFSQLAERKDAAFLGLRGLYQSAVARGDWEAANALAQRAEEINPGAAWLRNERARLAMRDGRWSEALGLAGPDGPRAALGTAAAAAATSSSEGRRLAQRAWKADMTFAPAAVAYALRLREAGRESKAQEVLRTSWSLAPHPSIAEASLAGGTYGMSHLARAEWLASAAPDNPESHFLRATANLEAGRLQQAREQAEAALAAGMDERRVWLLLSNIAEREGNRDAVDDAMRRAATAEPDPQWRCDACGAAQSDWHPACSNCGTVGKISWGRSSTGTRALLMAPDDSILL